MGYPKINAHIFRGERQLFRFRHLTRECDVPLVYLTLDRHRFNLALKFAMHCHLGCTYFTEVERPFDFLAHFLSSEFPTCSIRVGEAIVAVLALEAGVTGLLRSFSHSSETVLKCLVKSSQDIL